MGPIDILSAIVGIALLFLAVAAFYESLATRDVYVALIMRAARRRTARRARLALVYVATVGVGIPLLLVVWAVVLAIALVLVGSVDRAANAGLVAVLVVGAARVLAYAREKSAQELSKAIPLSLAFLLITGGALNIDQKLEQLRDAPRSGLLTFELLALLIGLELALRIGTDGVHVGLAEYRRRRGIEDGRGVWRTMWSTLRRPGTGVPMDEDGQRVSRRSAVD